MWETFYRGGKESGISGKEFKKFPTLSALQRQGF